MIYINRWVRQREKREYLVDAKLGIYIQKNISEISDETSNVIRYLSHAVSQESLALRNIWKLFAA